MFECGYDFEDVYYWVIEDDNGWIMVMICYNMDFGDGWECEGESCEYFELFLERYVYLLGINIVFYVMI